MNDVLETCNDRVKSKKETDETCYEELLDYVHCVDACVSIFFWPNLFKGVYIKK